MKELLRAAQKKFNDSCKGAESFNSARYYLGYIQAIKDVDRKLREEGIDELEEDD